MQKQSLISRDLLVEILRQNEIQVTFEKKDGTIREMVCTLKKEILEKMIPDFGKEVEDDKPKRVKTPNLEVISVFETTEKAWKSFRFDSLISIGLPFEDDKQ